MLVQGIGINDVDYNVAIMENGKQIWMCPVYVRWRDMLTRAGEKWQTKYPTYGGVGVSEEWVHLSNFKRWVDSYELGDLDGLQLDKDILIKGNKIYSPETCALVPQWLNKLLINCDKNSGLPLGVYYKKKNKKSISELKKPYYVQINSGDGKNQKWVGAFKTPEEAHKAWQLEKAQQIHNAVTRFRLEDSYRKDIEDVLICRAGLLTVAAQTNSIVNSL